MPSLISLSLYPVSIFFFLQSTYNSPKELIYLSTCCGLSLLLEYKCQKKKELSCSFSSPPFPNIGMLHRSILGPLPLAYTISHPLDRNIMCVDAICASPVDISLEYHIYTSNFLLETWILNRYLKFNMYSSISHPSLQSLI